MQAIQALLARDQELLLRIFSEIPEAAQAIDAQVKAHGFGSPMEFQTFGTRHFLKSKNGLFYWP